MQPEPVWVVGLPGCSVGRVAGLLGAHPRARMLPQTALWLADTVGALLLTFERSQDRLGDGLLRAVAAVCGFGQREAGIVSARDWLWRRGDWSSAALHAELCHRAAPQRPVFVDTLLGWRADYLTRLKALPPGDVIHLTRHPAHYCREMTQQLREQSFVPPDFRDYCDDPVGVIDPQLAWYRFNRNLREALEADSAHRYHRLRLEDLQERPAATLGRLLEAIDLPLETPEALLTAPVDPLLRPGPPNAPLGVEAECLRAPRLSLELRAPEPWPSHADWRADRRRTSADVGRLAAGFGYRQP